MNQLPPSVNSKHASEPDEEFLALNPTNIHTHGMLVAPRSPTDSNPTYGDKVFVLTFNKDNGQPVTSPHMHADVRIGFTDYEITIPRNHPSGLFWFHPHAHGLALNQVSSGLSGLITVGNIGDYVCKGKACANAMSDIAVRHIMLKDTQVLPAVPFRIRRIPISTPQAPHLESHQGRVRVPVKARRMTVLPITPAVNGLLL